MKAFRVILLCVLLLAGAVRPADAAARPRDLAIGSDLTPAAHEHLGRLAAASGGRARLVETADGPRLHVDGSAPLAAQLADWARTHGAELPDEDPYRHTAIAASATIAPGDNPGPNGGNDPLAFTSPAGSPRRCGPIAWADRTPGTFHRRPLLAERLAPRAPPAV